MNCLKAPRCFAPPAHSSQGSKANSRSISLRSWSEDTNCSGTPLEESEALSLSSYRVPVSLQARCSRIAARPCWLAIHLPHIHRRPSASPRRSSQMEAVWSAFSPATTASSSSNSLPLNGTSFPCSRKHRPLFQGAKPRMRRNPSLEPPRSGKAQLKRWAAPNHPRRA